MCLSRLRIDGLFQKHSWFFLSAKKESKLNPLLFRQASTQASLKKQRKEETPQYVGLNLSKSEMIKKLSIECIEASNPDKENKEVTATSPKTFDFVRFAKMLDNYFLLKSSREAMNLHGIFNQIKAREAEHKRSSNLLAFDEHNEPEQQNLFIKKLSIVLKKAGYIEIPDEKANWLLGVSSAMKEIHLEAYHQNYSVIKFWHRGRVDGDAAVWPLNWKLPSGWQKRKGYARVVVVTNHKNSGQLNVREFYNVPENQFKLLLSENSTMIPTERRVQVGSWKLVTSSWLITMLVSLYSDFSSFSFFIMPISFSLLAIITTRMEKGMRKEMEECRLQWKTLMVQRFICSGEDLIKNSLKSADERRMKQTLMAYGSAMLLNRQGKEISVDSINSFSRDWLVKNSDKGEERISDSYSIEATQAVERLLSLSILYQAGDSKLQVVAPDVATQALLNRVVDDAVVLTGAGEAVLDIQEDYMSF